MPTRRRENRRSARLRAIRARDERGFLLVEVLVSALMVAIIVVATYSGFFVASKTSASQRARDQATLLAAQSQEQLRSEPAAALDVLETSPRIYTKTLGGTVYTITQRAKPVGAKGSTVGCNVSSSKAQTAANFQISSTVEWGAAINKVRPHVTQVGVVTPPTGSGIEVDVVDGNHNGVAGVTIRASFIPVESGSIETLEATTETPGCVVLTGIQATEATIEVVEKSGYVTPSGALKVPPATLTIAPNVTTHYEVAYAEGGRIAAHFTYKGETSWGGQEVKNDTFVASNNGKLEVAPEYEIGSTSFASCEGAEEQSKAVTGVYATKAETAVCSRYSRGDLFPFSNSWLVYAGDCEANKDSEGEAAATVVNGKTTEVNVPLSYTELTVFTGNTPKSTETTKEALKPVKITNSGCASAPIPNNSWGFSYVHEQKETLTEGRLENPFQPFGKFSLCVVSPTLKKRYIDPFTNTTVAGTKPKIYLGQRTAAEQTARLNEKKAVETAINKEEEAATKAKEQRVKEETTEAPKAKEKRESEEATAKTAKEAREKAEAEAVKAVEKRATEETEMATARATREAAEKKLRETWTKEVSEGKLSSAKRTEKENTQKNERLTKESEEKKAKEKRESEEATAKTARVKRESEEATAKTAKETRASEEAAATTAKKTRETAEAEAPGQKTTREAAKKAAEKIVAEVKTEQKEEGETGVIVESGVTTC